MHVAGQHRKNTVAGILGALRPELGPLLPLHRLDKPVSGVLLFARSAAAAEVFRLQMQVRSPARGFPANVILVHVDAH